MNDWKWKAGAIGIIVLLICSLLFIVKLQQDQINKLDLIEKQNVEMKRLNDSLVRSSASYATKADLEKTIKDNGINYSDLKKDLKELRADVRAVSITTVVTPGYFGSNIPSTNNSPNENAPNVIIPEGCPNPDLHGYLKRIEYLALKEPFSDGKEIPFGRVDFTAANAKPWGVEVYPRKYKVTTVISRDENGRTFTHAQFSIDSNGETYTLPIDDSKVVEKLPAKRFRFVPRIYMGMGFGAIMNDPHAEFLPNLQMALFNYGSLKSSPDFTILGIGAGYEVEEDKVGFILTPATYNIAKHLPFMDNVHVGPAITVDTEKNIGLFAVLTVGL